VTNGGFALVSDNFGQCETESSVHTSTSRSLTINQHNSV